MTQTVGRHPSDDPRPATWDALLFKYDRVHGRIVADEAMVAGGFIQLYLDYLRLPEDEQHALRPLLGPMAFLRFEEVREAASVFRIADAKAALHADAARWFRDNGFQRLARPALLTTLEDLLARWDHDQDGCISGAELGATLMRGAELLVDVMHLSPAEQKRALGCLDHDARELLEQASELYRGLLATEQLHRLGPLPGEEA